MKKILLSAAAFAVVAVSAVAVAPTTSEAIPAFARQTGAACLSCHFQSFPTLNSFGRSFKEGAFTDVGEQALIEDDNLSIPSSLNITAMVRPQFISTNDGTLGVVPGGSKTKSIKATADQVLMIAGRIGSNTGAFLEMDTQGGGFGNNQLLHSIDMGSFKVIASYFSSVFGEDFGLQLMSVGGQHAGLLNGGALTISDAMARGRTTTGVSVAVANEMGAISLGGVDTTGTPGGSWSLAPVVRAQGFFDVGGMELGVGAIAVSGNNKTAANATASAKRFGFDVQLQGELGDTQVGVYADYANAAKSTATKSNLYNADLVSKRDGYSIRATAKPLHNVVAMIGVGQDKTGASKISKFTAGVEYEVYQNAVINLTYETVKYNAGYMLGAVQAAAVRAGGGLAQAGTIKTTTLDIEFLM